MFMLVMLLVIPLGGCRSAAAPEATTQPLEQPANLDYRLAPRDVLEIKFFYQSELNETVTIRPDGRISLQMIDEIQAAGMTPAELDLLLTREYARVVRSPEVAVIVKDFATRRVYVGGEVNTPGMLTYDDRLTVLQAIMQAGGFKKTAELATVIVLRDQGTSQPAFQSLDLRGELDGSRLPRNIALAPQDIIFVPRSPIAKMNDFVELYIEKLIPVQRSIGVYYDLSPETR